MGAIASISVIRPVAAAALDALGRHRKTVDVAVVLDAFSRTVQFVRVYTDAVGLSDVRMVDLAKALADAVTPADSFARQVQFVRAFADAAGLSDAKAIVLAKGLADSATANDAFSRTVQFTRLFADGVAMNDSAEASDGLLTSFGKGVSNVVFTADVLGLGISKPIADTSAASDAGLISNQNYAGPDYFAADYVGSSISF